MSTADGPSPSKVKWLIKETKSQPKREQTPSETDESLSVRLGSKRTMGPRKLTLQAVLQKPNRTIEEANFLFRVVKDMPFFADFNKTQNLEESDQEMLINLCKNIKYEKYSPTEIIFKEDQPSDGKFYIVMKGIVYVVQSVKKAKNFFEEQNRQLKEGANKKSNSNSPHETASRRSSQIFDSRRSSRSLSLQQPTLGSRKNSFQAGNGPDKDLKKNSLKINARAIEKLREFQKAQEVGREVQSPVIKSGDISAQLKKGGLSRFKAKGDRNKNQSIATIIFTAPAQEKTNKLEPQAKNSAAENIENKEEEENQEEKTEIKEENIEAGEDIAENDIPETNRNAHPAKLKTTTGKIMKMIKLKGVFGSEGKKTQGVTLQERVNEYGIYRDKIEQGGSFGHAALQKGDVKRNATMLAATMVELLVIQKEDLQLIREHFYKTRTQMREFLLKYFPCMDDVNASKTIEGYLYLMKEGIYNQNTVICQEGTINDKVFIIFEGKCQLLKTFTVDQSNYHKVGDLNHYKRSTKLPPQMLPISLLERGSFIGEETLFNQHERYEYTAKVISSRAVIYSIDREMFSVRFPKMTFEGIRQMHVLRQANHLEVVNSILKTKYPSMNVVQKQETLETGDETEERDLTQLKLSEQVFANPITVLPHHDPLHKKTITKEAITQKDSNMTRLKNKLLEYSHEFYPHHNETGTSPHNFYRQAANIKDPKESRSKLRVGLSDVEKTSIDEFKNQLQELQLEEKQLKAEKSGTVSLKEARYQNSQRKLALRNQEKERSPADQYLDRALKNFSSEKRAFFKKSKNPTDINDYRLGFGREYEVNRKKKGWDSSRQAKTSRTPSTKEINPGILNLIDCFVKAKDKSVTSGQKFDTSFQTEKVRIHGAPDNSSTESPQNHFIPLRGSKPLLQNVTITLDSHSLGDDQLQAKGSINSPYERDNSYGFIFITSTKEGSKRSLQIEDARSFALNTERSKRETDPSKEAKRDAVVQNLVRKYQTLKALNKHSHYSKTADRSSLLVGNLTPKNLELNYNQSDALKAEILPDISSSQNTGRHFHSESYKL